MNRGIDADVQERMNAYRGNPQALMQRYAQSQQLVDLLALQKLKSDKEAAARQMQMQMGQGGLPTIAQQREQEVMDMTKQEVAQRVGGVGRQQAQQQQQNLQQAMQGGIAQAPSPNIAQFKEGGIIGYAGPDGSVVQSSPAGRFFGNVAETVGSTLEDVAARQEASNQEEAEKRRLRKAIGDTLGMSPGISGAFVPQSSEDWKRATEIANIAGTRLATVDDLRKAFAAATQLRAAKAPAPAAPTPAAPSSPAFAKPDQSYATKEARGLPAVAPKSTPEQYAAATFDLAPGSDYEQTMREVATIPDPQERAAAMAALQRAKPSAPQGAGQPAATAGIAAALPGQLGKTFEEAIGPALKPDLKAIGAEDEAAYRKRFDPFFQEAIARKQAAIDEAKQLEAREQAARDPLTAFLLGAQGRTIGETLGSAGRNVADYQAKAIARDRALMQERQKLLEELGAAKVAPEEKAYTAYQEAQKRALGAQEKAFAPAASVIGAQLSSDARREIAERDAVIREQNRALGLDEKTSNMIRQRIDAATKIINAKYDEELTKGEGKFDPAAATRIKAARDAETLQAIRAVYAEFKKTPPEIPGMTSAPAAPTGQPVVQFDALKTGK